MMEEMIGFAAACCTTFALAPQLLKAWRSRSTADISLAWAVTFAIGTILWLAYGLLMKDIPIIAANGTSLLFIVTMLMLKLRHG
jgi:MtN3 and saliva related transmembrane protein